MAEEEKAEGAAEAAPQTTATKAVPLLRGIVRGTLLHDDREYANGSEFATADEKLFNELRRVGALKTAADMAPAAATVIEQQSSEIAALRAQIEELTKAALARGGAPGAATSVSVATGKAASSK